MPKCATAAYELSPGTIQVWQIDLSIDAIQAQSCREMLSNDENQRASRFHFEKDKLRFVASRAALRTILSRYLNLAPKELAFSYGIHGKPELAPPLSESALTFNLSHSRERALLAISINSRIGADIEYVDQQFASDEIAEHFFSTREVSALRALPAEIRRAAFFSCWTRKEAYIKAVGVGLSLPLDSFDVAFGPGVPPSLIRVKGAPCEELRWAIYDIAPPQGFAAAVIVEGAGHRLCHREWNWPTCPRD